MRLSTCAVSCRPHIRRPRAHCWWCVHMESYPLSPPLSLRDCCLRTAPPMIVATVVPHSVRVFPDAECSWPCLHHSGGRRAPHLWLASQAPGHIACACIVRHAFLPPTFAAARRGRLRWASASTLRSASSFSACLASESSLSLSAIRRHDVQLSGQGCLRRPAPPQLPAAVYARGTT